MRSSRFRGAAHILFQEHGAASETVAGDHAEERFANIDVGGFAYWKNVETFIRDVLHRAALPSFSSTTENIGLAVAAPFPAVPYRDHVSTSFSAASWPGMNTCRSHSPSQR